MDTKWTQSLTKNSRGGWVSSGGGQIQLKQAHNVPGAAKASILICLDFHGYNQTLLSDQTSPSNQTRDEMNS